MNEHERAPAPDRDVAPGDDAFLDWVSESVREAEVPVPLPLEMKLNEMNHAAARPPRARGTEILVVTLVIVLVAGSLASNLADPATLLGVFLLAGAFAAALVPASSGGQQPPSEELG
jgi:hypothetical protein